MVNTSHRTPVPFDEPTLGIIGMWRLGGGANPYFALTLGEIMLRVGQRYIAWCAYERAVGLAERYSADPEIRRQFTEHCRRRQELIEKQLPEPERAELRPRFEEELAYGQDYRRAYQQYEKEQIARGISLDDPHFYDAFHAAHEPIASPVGPADTFVTEQGDNADLFLSDPLPAVLFFAGASAFVTACFLRTVALRQHVRTRTASAPPG
jgi:hypothetical protein